MSIYSGSMPASFKVLLINHNLIEFKFFEMHFNDGGLKSNSPVKF